MRDSNKVSGALMEEKKKGFLDSILDKLDNKLEEKSKKKCCCDKKGKKGC